MTISASGLSRAELQQAARDHLWLHFTRMSAYAESEIPIIVRGDGCYLEDSNGKRYLDALAGLFAVQIGYGFGEEMGEAAAAQMRELPFYTNWSYAHPRAIELAAEVASLAPGDLNRVFFCSGGSEAVESAWKLARQYHAVRGERRWKAVARRIAYHGTTMGALSINGVAALRAPFEPLVPDTIHVWNTNRYHRPPEETEAEFTAFLLEDLEEAILQAGPETVAMVIMEPVQNAGGALTPPAGYWPGVREVCDRYGILLCADEVITAFGRLGHWFGSERYDIRPDIVTSAKGLSSAHATIGAVIARDSVMEPFLEGSSMYTHGITFGGHPVQAAIALKNIEIMKRERIVEHVAEHQDLLREKLETLLELPIVGNVRGTGFFYAVELVKDEDTRETFGEEESEWLLRGFLSGKLFERGLICRADDRGDPVVQISPPLVAGPAEFDEIVGILGDVLSEAWSEYDRWRGALPAGAPEGPVSPGVVPGTRVKRQP
jgi:adenosylmethionine-8-amino-7-oxononanoate aminotransferase